MDNKLLQPGTMLRGGTYRVERQLSSGGFGNTYVVTNVSFDETFAMKEFFMKDINMREGATVTVSIPDNRSTFDTQRNKFLKEARRLRKLKNDHIVGVHDLFEENGTTYYVMDFIDGESLNARLKRTGQPLSEEEVRRILPQLLDALETIHQQGIWHLDLKPGNIMMTKEGKALLIDFGASKQMTPGEGVTTSSGLCYTPGYAPIEQIEQNIDKFGPWTDIYSLGATLYNLLSRNSLPSPTELMDMGESALQYPPTVSPQMRQLIFRMMQTSRMQRPQSVAEVRQLLNGKSSVAEETVAVPATPKNEETQVVTPPSVPKPKVTPPPPAAPPKNIPPAPKPETRKPAPVYMEPKKSRPIWPFIAAAAVLLVLVLGAGGFFLSRALTSDKAAVVETTPNDEPTTKTELEPLASVTPEPANDSPEATTTPPKAEPTTPVREEPAPAQPVRPTRQETNAVPSTTSTRAATTTPSGDNTIHDVAEQMPSFKNGDARAWLARNIQYPPVAAEKSISGLVLVSFVVEKDGSLSNVKVTRGIDPSLDKEAIRVVKSMPRWNPGKQNGAVVRVKYTLPVQFKLQ